MCQFFTSLEFFYHIHPMTRRNLLIWGLLGMAVAMGIFVQKTRKLLTPDAITSHSEVAPPFESLVIRDPPIEWRSADKGWDLFTLPATEPAKFNPEVAKEKTETPSNLTIEGYVAVADGPAYVILRNAVTGQTHRLACREAIPDTDFTVTNFCFDGPCLIVEVSTEGGQCFTIFAENGPNSLPTSRQNTSQ
jgi:hypothetical protein